MAETLTDFMAELEKREPDPWVGPQLYYGAGEDALTFYFRPEESYARRLNSLITVFLSFDKHELVGCQVKGLRRKLEENDGEFGVRIRRGDRVELGLFFHLLAYDVSDPEPRNRLIELGQRAKGFALDAKELALSTR